MDILTVFLSVLFFTLLGTAYCKGYDFTAKHSHEKLPQFYLVMTVIRFILVMTVIGLYAVFSTDRTKTIEFAITFFAMYVVMMVVTLKLKH